MMKCSASEIGGPTCLALPHVCFLMVVGREDIAWGI